MRREKLWRQYDESPTVYGCCLTEVECNTLERILTGEAMLMSMTVSEAVPERRVAARREAGKPRRDMANRRYRADGSEIKYGRRNFDRRG